MANLATQAQTEIGGLQQQLRRRAARRRGRYWRYAGGNTGRDRSSNGPAHSWRAGRRRRQPAVGVGLDSTQVPGATPGATPSATPAVTGATPGAWTPQSLVGTSVQLQAGTNPNGTVIADPGNYRIAQPVGDPNGYATADEANAVARTTMSTELMGSKFLRWMVVEHEGRFHGVVAKQLAEGEQATPLGPALGNVVAWSAMNHVADGGQSGWQAYSWSQAAGAQSMAIPYGTTTVFPGGAVGAGSAGTTPAPAGTAPTAADAARSEEADPSRALPPLARASTRRRQSDARSQSTLHARLRATLPAAACCRSSASSTRSTGGFGTAEEAAQVARAARTASGATTSGRAGCRCRAAMVASTSTRPQSWRARLRRSRTRPRCTLRSRVRRVLRRRQLVMAGAARPHLKRAVGGELRRANR